MFFQLLKWGLKFYNTRHLAIVTIDLSYNNKSCLLSVILNPGDIILYSNVYNHILKMLLRYISSFSVPPYVNRNQWPIVQKQREEVILSYTNMILSIGTGSKTRACLMSTKMTFNNASKSIGLFTFFLIYCQWCYSVLPFIV